MKYAFIHLSDLHFRENWPEGVGSVIDALFEDLSIQLSIIKGHIPFFIFSGDIVQGGSSNEQYQGFFGSFEKKLSTLGVTKENRICIPGNHDVNRNNILAKIVEHKGITAVKFTEKELNDYIHQNPDLLTSKFDSFSTFQRDFGREVIGTPAFCGGGFEHGTIGIYCLNSALFSMGGIDDIDDKGKLLVETRKMVEWAAKSTCLYKILVMHHPLDWLVEWNRRDVEYLIKKHFQVVLFGHTHEQSVMHKFHTNSSVIEIVSPPIFTSKDGKLGYSIFIGSDRRPERIVYRQWLASGKFVRGVAFSENDSGEVVFATVANTSSTANPTQQFITQEMENAFDRARKSFQSIPAVWVEPKLSKNIDRLDSSSIKDDKSIKASDFIDKIEKTLVTAPPQFGLTCLGLFLRLEIWKKKSEFWIYLDVKNYKWHALEKYVQEVLKSFRLEVSDVKGVIIDSWQYEEKHSEKYINGVLKYFPNLPVLLLQTIDNARYLTYEPEEAIECQFDRYHLTSLSRSSVRELVTVVNEKHYIGEEESVLSRMVSDLETFNLHRTPLNCLTLLKAWEAHFDENPVNRTEVIHRILFILFNLDTSLTYKNKLDLKDCEFVLGRFCEELLRKSEYSFSKHMWESSVTEFCKERMISLDVPSLFSIMIENGIIQGRGNDFCFRYSYWVHYFAAKRMHQDPGFAEFVFSSKFHLSIPEVVEFYTGIDRSRTNALVQLCGDITEIYTKAVEKSGMPTEMNPYQIARWDPTEESMVAVQKSIGSTVNNSKLPAEVKDRFADQGYDRHKPFDQSIQFIFQEYHFAVLMQVVKAASRALRNSDYTDPEIKKKLLNEIFKSWGIITNVLFALTPILAAKGQAGIQGANFILADGFGETFADKVKLIFTHIPENILKLFKDDLFSLKMGPLILDKFEQEQDPVLKMEIAMLIIACRPDAWEKAILTYIQQLQKNSFYLYKMYTCLEYEYSYGFASNREVLEIGNLIKACIAKHFRSTDKPGISDIKKIPDTSLPSRSEQSL